MAVLRTSPALRSARRSSGSMTAAAALASWDEREESPAAPRLRDESAYIDTFPGKKRHSCETAVSDVRGWSARVHAACVQHQRPKHAPRNARVGGICPENITWGSSAKRMEILRHPINVSSGNVGFKYKSQ